MADAYKEQRAQTEYLKRLADKPLQELEFIHGLMLETGLKQEAHRLEKINARIKYWQNTRQKYT